MNTQPKRRAFQIAMAVLVLDCISAHSDTVFVWSDDSTIKQFTTNGVGSVLASNIYISGWNGPVGLALDNAGDLYSGSPSASYVTKYTTNGVGSVVGYHDSVSGLAFDRTGNLYETSPNYNSICNPQGYFLDPLYCTQSHLSYPTSLAFDSVGNLYVANAADGTIPKFSPDLTYLGDFATGLNEPWGLAFDQAGNLFVSNSGTNGVLKNTIVKFTPNGDRSTFASSGLKNPRGLAFDRAGNLYVANASNGTIKKYTPDGISSTFASGLNSPTSIAIQPGLKLWPTSITLISSMMLPDGAFQFAFANTPGMSFSALGTTNVSLPLSNWTVLGGVTDISLGQYYFIDTKATNNPQRFYRVRAN